MYLRFPDREDDPISFQFCAVRHRTRATPIGMMSRS